MADGNFNNVTATGYVSAAGNVVGGLIKSSTTISAVGNITGTNLKATGSVLANSIVATGSIVAFGNISTPLNIISAYAVSAVGNITSNNISATNLTALSVSGANLITTNYAAIGVNTNNALSVSGNILVGGAGTGAISAQGNIRTNSYFVGDGSKLSNINISNLTSVGSISVAGVVTANYFVGDGSRLSNVTTSSASTAVIVTGNSQPNITRLGTLSNLSVAGTTATYNLSATGAVIAGGNISGQYIVGNGAFLTGVTTSSTMPSRTSVGNSTGIVAANAVSNLTITGFKGYALYAIQTSAPAWITVYSSYSFRSLDASRSQGTDPAPGSGVIAELVSTTPITQYFTPGVVGFSTESPPSTDIPIRVVNTTTNYSNITVTLTLVKMEG